jgi:DNA-binding XRE family transcriptional regulator
MSRTLEEVMNALPAERRERVEARYRELKDEVESLRQLRKVAGKAQVDIAAALHIKQPSVSKIESQADMYLSTLRSYIEAIGGELELIVRLPSRPAMRLQCVADVFATPRTAARSRAARSGTVKRATART